MDVVLVSSAEHRHVDPDLPLIVEAATRAGLTAGVVVWDDPVVPWWEHDHVVLRSVWDYVPRRDELLDWARTVPRLRNGVTTLTWNTDKTYLRQLEAAGVDVVDTQWSVRHGDPLADADEWVVKPTISAGSADTARWSTPEQVWAHSEHLLAQGRPTMVQPYVPSVDDEGETALLFFGGAFSHAVRKGAMLHPGAGAQAEAQLDEPISSRTPRPDQLSAARRALSAATSILGEAPLYARVDVVTDPTGTVRVLELELVEPSLFLDHAPGSADRFVAAILAD